MRFFVGTALPEPDAGDLIDRSVATGLQTTGEVLAAAVRARGRRNVAQVAESLRSLAGAITCPTLVIHGELDRICPLHRDRAIADTLGAPLEVVAQAGHCPQATRPERVNALIDGFAATHLRS